MFAKIFSQIYDSSIVEDPETRFTFMDLLVLSDMDGVVDMTHEAIARRTNRPLEVIRSTILKLEAPDGRSRTLNEDGRRLKRLDDHRDWGWMIINYERFRKIASEEQRREKTRLRVAKFKAKNRGEIASGNAVVTHANAINARSEGRGQRAEGRGQRAEADVNEQNTKTHTPDSEKPDVVHLDGKAKGSESEVVSFCKSLNLPENDGVWFFARCEGNGWKNNGQPIKDWKATIRAWKAAGYMASQKVNGQRSGGGKPRLVADHSKGF